MDIHIDVCKSIIHSNIHIRCYHCLENKTHLTELLTRDGPIQFLILTNNTEVLNHEAHCCIPTPRSRR